MLKVCLGDSWESSSFLLKVNTSIINRSHGLLEKEKGLKECFSTHYRGLEMEELLELMEDVRIKENRMWRFQWYKRNAHLAIGETERERERSGGRKRKHEYEGEGEKEKKLTRAQINAILSSWRHSLKGLFYLFIYLFIFWRTPKQQETSPTLKAARKSATGPVRK